MCVCVYIVNEEKEEEKNPNVSIMWSDEARVRTCSVVVGP